MRYVIKLNCGVFVKSYNSHTLHRYDAIRFKTKAEAAAYMLCYRDDMSYSIEPAWTLQELDKQIDELIDLRTELKELE